jgi:hypothetical protein
MNYQASALAGSTSCNLQTNQGISDTTKWHNWHIEVDTNQSTAANRVKIWLDAVACTYSSALYPSLGEIDIGIGGIGGWQIFYDHFTEPAYGEFDLFYYIDGQALDPSYFTTGSGANCYPKSYAGGYGVGGFLFDFENNTNLTTLGYDTSGNGNNLTLNSNFALPGDSVLDAPFNPLIPLPMSASGNFAINATVHSHLSTLETPPPMVGVGALAASAVIGTHRQVGTPSILAGATILAASTRQFQQSGSAAFAYGALVMNPALVSILIDPHSARTRLAGTGTFGANGTIFTQLDFYSLDIVNRVKMLIPNRWFSWVAPIRDAVLGGLADVMAWCRSLIDYARMQSRLATCTGIFLDIFAFDYLRRYLLRRGANDAVFRAKIKATILQERVTRNGMNYAINQLTGSNPSIFEPWNTGDAGGWGTGLFAFNRAGGWGSIQLPGQVFMRVSRAGVGPTGVPNVEGYGGGLGGYGVGRIEYVGSTVSQIGVTDDDIYQIVQATKPIGTTIWTQID